MPAYGFTRQRLPRPNKKGEQRELFHLADSEDGLPARGTGALDSRPPVLQLDLLGILDLPILLLLVDAVTCHYWQASSRRIPLLSLYKPEPKRLKTG